VRSLLKWLTRRLARQRRATPAGYWDERAKHFGRRAVYNLGHDDTELQLVDEQQKSILFPILSAHLSGTERVALDLGCGVGRFSEDIARLAQAKVTAIDISHELLALAPRSAGVAFILGSATDLPFPNEHFDLIWACLVLGALRNTSLRDACHEMQRVAKPGALLFLVENTTPAPDGPSWAFRSWTCYKSLLPRFELGLAATYDDLGETISVMTGRRS